MTCSRPMASPSAGAIRSCRPPAHHAGGMSCPAKRSLTGPASLASLACMKFPPRGAISRRTAFGLAALALFSALAYWGVSAYRKSQLERTVAALARDPSERLGAALALEAEAATANDVQTVGKLDEQAQEVDKLVLDLHDLGASPNRALVAAAEDYLLTVRQILRQQAASHRYRVQVKASEEKLREHMRTSGRRSGAWIDEAVRAKDRLEKNYFD